MRRPISVRKDDRRSKSVRTRRRACKRQFTDICTKVAGRKSKLNYLSLKEGGLAWKIKTISNTARTHSAVRIREGTSWLSGGVFPQTATDIPFIDSTGKFTGCSMYHANLKPEAYIGTVISTVYRRLTSLVHRRFGRSYKINSQWSNLMLGCSTYYSLTKNNYFHDRLLALLREGRRETIRKVLYYFVSKLDANKWFVYSHALFQSKWLTFRAKRPRDKSSKGSPSVTKYNIVFGAGGEKQFKYEAVWHCYVAMSHVTYDESRSATAHL